MFLTLICFGLCFNIRTLYMCLRRGQIEGGMENRDVCNLVAPKRAVLFVVGGLVERHASSLFFI